MAKKKTETNEEEKPKQKPIEQQLSVKDADRIFADGHHVWLVEASIRDRMLGGLPKGGGSLDWYIDNRFQSDAEKEAFRERVKEGALTDEGEIPRVHELVQNRIPIQRRHLADPIGFKLFRAFVIIDIYDNLLNETTFAPDY